MSDCKKRNKKYASNVIIGAGLAGMNSAVQLAKLGVRCTVIDENSVIGGVVHCGSLRSQNTSDHLGKKPKTSIEEVRREYRRYSGYIDLCLNVQVLGTMRGTEQLALLGKNGFYSIDYDRLIVSTGCHEKAVPFPGWDLPGVMTVGGAQIQVKNGLVRPGQRIILVGTGPLLLVAATQLHLAGVQVLGVYESGRRIDLIRNTFSLLKNVPLLKEGLAYHRFLKKFHIPFRYGWGLVEARGDGELSEVVLAPYDYDWRPVNRKRKVIKADCLGVEYGFVSRSQLTQLFGIEHQFDEFSGWRPVRDEMGRTSRDHVYVAGDIAGVYGAQVAAEEGKLAALALMLDSGRKDQKEVKRYASSIRKTIKRYVQFRNAFSDFSRSRFGLLDLPREDTVICRCENINRGQIDRALEQGVKDITTLKMVTRIGMGDCQGKMFPTLWSELVENHGVDFKFEKTGLKYLIYDEYGWAHARQIADSIPHLSGQLRWFDEKQLRENGPFVSKEAIGALEFTRDHQVNPYLLTRAFREGARRQGASFFLNAELTAVNMNENKVMSVQITDGTINCGLLINATGAWASDITKMVIGHEIPVVPVKGQVVLSEKMPKLMRSCISTSDCYIAQKDNGEIYIGSTTEEGGYDTSCSYDELRELSKGAVRCFPILRQHFIKRTWAGLRPGTPDEIPILGPIDGIEGYLNACGHFRTGILTSAITGEVIQCLVTGKKPPVDLTPFLLSRFDNFGSKNRVEETTQKSDAVSDVVF